jgi:branched-chain amino acid transport system ATP-binding protein
LLSLRRLNAFYGQVHVLHDLDIEVGAGRMVGLVGANAAGKTTTVMTIAGLRTRSTGQIAVDGEPIDRLPAYERVERGVVLVPERKRLFPFMSVLENLELGAYSARARARRRQRLDHVLALLPVLADRRTQLAGSLSGGEQQMCAIGRALMACPRILILDEPTEGLAPLYVTRVFQLVARLREEGITILIIEQNVRHVLQMVDHAYVLENGRIVLEGAGPALLENPRLRTAYLGV